MYMYAYVPPTSRVLLIVVPFPTVVRPQLQGPLYSAHANAACSIHATGSSQHNSKNKAAWNDRVTARQEDATVSQLARADSRGAPLSDYTAVQRCAMRISAHGTFTCQCKQVHSQSPYTGSCATSVRNACASMPAGRVCTRIESRRGRRPAQTCNFQPRRIRCALMRMRFTISRRRTVISHMQIHQEPQRHRQNAYVTTHGVERQGTASVHNTRRNYNVPA